MTENLQSNRSRTAPHASAPRFFRISHIGQALGLAVGLTLALSACQPSNGDKPGKPGESAASSAPSAGAPKAASRALLATAETAQMREFSPVLTVDAELRTQGLSTLTSELAARVLELKVKPGDEVKAGQLLAVLDDRDARLTMQEAASAAEQAQALQQERLRARDRAEALFSKDFVSQTTRDAAQTEWAVANAQLQAAQSRLTLAQRAANKAQVRAPHDGVVTQVPTAQGAQVRVGDSLVQVWRPGSNFVAIKVPQEYLGAVSTGQPVELLTPGGSVTVELSRVSPLVSATSRSFEAFAPAPETLASTAGLSLSAKLKLSPRQALAVPVEAVQLEGLQARVVKAVQGRAQFATVELGPQQDGWVEITKGLEAGAVVVLQGASLARDGQPLTIQSAPAAKDSAKTAAPDAAPKAPASAPNGSGA